MSLRTPWPPPSQALAPALAAAAAGALAEAVWGSPALSLAVAAAGAFVGAAAMAPDPADRGERPRPRAVAAPEADPAPPGLGLPPGAERALAETLPLGVLLIDGDGQVRYLNPAARDLFGRQPDGPFHPAALRAPKLLAALEQCRSEGGPASVEFTLMRGSELHLRAEVRPLAAGERTVPGALLVVLEDVTRSRRSEELFRDFVANASHELKTPLASISGIIETLQGHARDDPAATERFLDIMAAQAERMRRLVIDMLSLNRIEQNERVLPRTPQRLRDIVGETADAMAPIAEAAEIALEAELPEASVVVLGSREELGQVFQNLIDNAVKYGRPGDRVRIAPVEAPRERPGMVGIAVSDTGPGIARTHLPRLTERFYRVSVPKSRARGGTGLGLAIVKHVLTRHRGQLQIESEVGKGSCFTVWLPRAPVQEV